MASPATGEFSDVIDWTEAMEQCGDDEEFLRELLSDLRGEIDAQIVKIDDVLKVRRAGMPCLRPVSSNRGGSSRGVGCCSAR